MIFQCELLSITPTRVVDCLKMSSDDELLPPKEVDYTFEYLCGKSSFLC